MYIKQLYTSCLAEAAYYIESNGEAAIIDPLRDTETYLALAKDRGATVKYILETHFHADFVSGHLDLAKETNATIVYGPGAEPEFEAHIAQDNEILHLGNISLKVLHTPGHTMESVTFLLLDEQGKEQAIFTGDTLFIGDVGRPDLAVKSNLSREDLAKHLYHSLHHQIMPLPNHITVYPGHGQGSACGKNMSSETTDSLGNQKRSNYALNPELTEDQFIKELTSGLVTPPQYFPKNALLNKEGYDTLSSILVRGMEPLSVEEFETKRAQPNTVVLDTRHQNDFVNGHIPNSIYIGLDGQFATWVGTLIMDLNAPIIFIADEGREHEVVTRLSRVGYDNAQGFLQGGLEAWQKAGKAIATMDEINPDEVTEHYETIKNGLVDVRKKSEYNSRHLEGIPSHPLDFIHEEVKHFQPNKTYYLHCAGGYRSVIAGSILRTKGIANVVNVMGGFDQLKSRQLPLSQEKEVETML